MSRFFPSAEPADERRAPRATLGRGDRLGAYEIVRLIGVGGMGQVYRARDTRLGREVAVKVLSPAAANAQALSRLAAEARAASALNHPNLVTVFELVEDAPLTYLVTELVEGETVREMLRDGPLPVDRAIDVARQAAEGLARAHASGIVHRDVKPENLMVRPDGLVKILDFGLVKRLPGAGRSHAAAAAVPSGPLTEPGLVIGTAAYMSPEQVRGEPVGAASDVFALGIVLCEMLAGRHPFPRESGAAAMSAILRDAPDPLPDSVPVGARELVRRCLAKRVADRPASAVELAAELAALVPLPAAPEKPDPAAAPASSRRGRRLFFALVGACTLASAVLARAAGTNLAPGPRQEVNNMSDTPRSILMPDSSREDQSGPIERRDEQVGENRRDQSFQEVPAPQGLKTPPLREVGEDSGEWTTGGGSDPNELEDTQPSKDEPSR